MCMIETKVYVSTSGGEWEQEIAHPCKRASAGRLCSKVDRKTTRAGLIERRAARDASPEERPPRHQERRIVIEKSRYVAKPDSPASSSASSSRSVYPAAPSPPLPRYRNIDRALQDCPMMSGGLGSGDAPRPPSPSYDFVSDRPASTSDGRPPVLPRLSADIDTDGSRDSRRKVSIEIPVENEYVTPKLGPPPLRRKSVKIEHKRADSAKAFPAAERLAQAEQGAYHQEAAERARERLEAQMDAASRRIEASEDARLRREEDEIERQAEREHLLTSLRQDHYRDPPSMQRRESRSGKHPKSERQRQNEAAARTAFKAAERVQRAEMAERDRERRLEGERRAAERERRESDARKQEREWAMQRREDIEIDYSPRRLRQAPVVHYDDPIIERAATTGQRARGAEIIASEQARRAREELAATMQDLALGDPFARGPDADNSRLDRMRGYREEQRRRIGM